MKYTYLLILLAIFTFLPIEGSAYGVMDGIGYDIEEPYDDSEPVVVCFRNSLSGENVAYANIENPITLKFNGIRITNPENLAIISSGKQKTASVYHDENGGPYDFIMIPTKVGTSHYTIVEWVGKQRVEIARFKVKVYALPTPIIYLGAFRNGSSIFREDLYNDDYKLTVGFDRLVVKMAEPKIVSFKMSVESSVYIRNEGDYLNNAMLDLIYHASERNRIKFHDIEVRYANGETTTAKAEFILR